MTLLPMVLIILESISQYLCFSPKIDKYHELSGDSTFSSIGATIADNFNVELPEFGKSYLNEMGVEH